MSKIYYTEEHEWVELEGDVAKVGITNYAQDQLGDLVFVELPELGGTVGKGDTVVVVESVKAASDVYSPLSGEIIEVNSDLEQDPSLVNKAAESDGWLWKMRVENMSEFEGLLDLAAYENLIK